MPKYVIVVESGADVPPELVERYGITVVPMHFALGEDFINDGELTVEEVFAYFETTHKLPLTSGCSPRDFAKAFKGIHEKNPEATIVHLGYSAVTTCSYESALVAAQEYDCIKHYDTKAVSIGQAAVVLSIAEYLDENPEADFEEVDAVIKDRIERVRMAFTTDALTYLHAGGRLSNLAFMGSQILKIRPLIEILDGKLTATRKYRGSYLKVVSKILQEYLERITWDKEHIHLAYSPGLKQEIKDFAEGYFKRFGFKRISWMKTGCVVSCHGGPGIFGVIGFATAKSQ
jgi:DegV family protein with EDD domain